MSFWLILSACILAVPYVGVPIFIRFTQRVFAKPVLRQLLPDFLPSEVKFAFDKIQKALVLRDFLYCFDAVSQDHVSASRLYHRAFVHRREKVLAFATFFLAGETRVQVNPLIEFASQFSDGTRISVHNSDFLGAPLHSNRDVSHAFALVKDPLELFRIHSLYIQRFASRKIAVLPDEGAEWDVMKTHLADELAAQAQMGALCLDSSGEYYRLTWAGAFIMTWYNMWPWVFFRRFYQRLKAKFWLRRFSSI